MVTGVLLVPTVKDLVNTVPAIKMFPEASRLPAEILPVALICPVVDTLPVDTLPDITALLID